MLFYQLIVRIFGFYRKAQGRVLGLEKLEVID